MTRDEIKAIYDAGPETVITLVLNLVEQIEQLTDRVAELEAQLATNSRNSSQPPSSDSPAKPIKPTRQPSGRKPGGQKGHPGTTLKPSSQPDHIQRHWRQSCAHCQQSLEAVAGSDAPETRQVFDLPPLKLEVTEHRLVNKNLSVLRLGQRRRVPRRHPTRRQLWREPQIAGGLPGQLSSAALAARL